MGMFDNYPTSSATPSAPGTTPPNPFGAPQAMPQVAPDPFGAPQPASNPFAAPPSTVEASAFNVSIQPAPSFPVANAAQTAIPVAPSLAHMPFNPPVQLDTAQIGKIGAKERGKLTQLSTDVLKTVTAREVMNTDMAEQLTSVVLIAKKFDPNSLKDGPVGFWGKLTGAVAAKKEQALTNFQNLNDRVDTVATQLQGHIVAKERLIQFLDAYRAELGNCYIATRQIIADKTQELEKLTAWYQTLNPNSFQQMDALQYRDYGTALIAMRNHIHELNASCELIVQTATSMTVQRETAVTLISKTQSALQIGIGAWRQQFAIAWANANNKSTAEAVDAVTGFVNQLIVSNAATTRDVAVATQKMASSTIIKAESIEQAAGMLTAAFTETAAIMAESDQKQKEDAKRMAEANQKLLIAAKQNPAQTSY